jgi:hypothetical protein
MSRRSAGDRHLTNEEVDRLLAGTHGADSVLGRYLARLQEIGAVEPGAAVVDRDRDAIARELEKARGRRPGRVRRSLSTTSRLGGSRVLIPIRRLAPRNVLVGFAAVVMTAGMAAGATGNLPAPAQDLVSKTMALIGVDIPSDATDSPELTRVGSSVPVEAEIRPEENSAVRPTVSGVEIPETSVDTVLVPPEQPGPTSEEPHHQDLPVDPPDEQAVVVPPAKPGPADNQDPVDDAAPATDPEPTDDQVPVDDAAPATDPGPADNPGPPDHAGPPTDPGPADNPGPPDHAGPLTSPGPADNPGPPDHAAAGEQPGQSQSGFRTGEDSG